MTLWLYISWIILSSAGVCKSVCSLFFAIFILERIKKRFRFQPHRMYDTPYLMKMRYQKNRLHVFHKAYVQLIFGICSLFQAIFAILSQLAPFQIATGKKCLTRWSYITRVNTLQPLTCLLSVGGLRAENTPGTPFQSAVHVACTCTADRNLKNSVRRNER